MKYFKTFFITNYDCLSFYYILQTFINSESAGLAEMADQAFTTTLGTVGEEVKSKYARISSEIREEMTELFDLMEKEMDNLRLVITGSNHP